MESNTSSHPSDRDLVEFVIAVMAVEAFMVVFFNHCKVYDLATAAFVSYGLGLMARGRILQYLGVFALANFNRETMFLLILVFTVYFFWTLEWRKYLLAVAIQLLLFGAVRLYTMTLFAGSPGDVMLIRPIENLQLFLESPIAGLVHWALFALVLWLCLRRWRSTHRLLQVAFVVMMPLLLALYLVAGWSYEVRVFAEVYPVAWAIAWKV